MTKGLRTDEMVCPYCGESLVYDRSGEGLDICRDHGVVEGYAITLAQYEKQEKQDD